jgi:tRNA (cmo5U34)-methyltransferase
MAMTEDLFGSFEAQKDFTSVDEMIETEHACPSCGYGWSGSPNSSVDQEAVTRFIEIIEKVETLFGVEEVKRSIPAPVNYRCPKCRHEWTGEAAGKSEASPAGSLEFGRVGESGRRGMIIREELVDKPPYRVPLMKEIAALPWNGFNVVSTFSGCGGSSLGYKMAGFRVLWASEFIPAAQETYRANHPGTILDTRDIRQVKASDIEAAIGMSGREIDLLDGSPPCASFSTAGKREAGWGTEKKYSDTTQRTDDLFFEFARILKDLQPKTFVAENVSGLVKGSAKGYFIEILKALKECGYRVSVKVLDAQYLGVPQMRQRTIFVGVREDLGVEPRHPSPLPYVYTVRDALPWIVRARTHSGGVPVWKDASTDPSPTIKARVPSESEIRKDESRDGINGVIEARVSACQNYGEKTEWLDVNESPAPARIAGAGTDGLLKIEHPIESVQYYEEIIGVRETTMTGKEGESWKLPEDGPSPTITASIPGVNRGRASGGLVEVQKVPVRVIHDTSGNFSQGDVTDRPCPAITVGVDSLNSRHYQVEEERLLVERLVEPECDISRYVREKTSIVDLGCSRGDAIAELINSFGAHCMFIGCDVSQPMIKAARERFSGYENCGVVRISEVDLRTHYPAATASLTLAILTIQFTPIEHRQKILRNVYKHTLPGGAFIFVEKVLGADADIDEKLVDLYYDMKRSNGYSQESIDRKRLSLEGVLVPVTAAWNEAMLRSAGFRSVDCFWRNLNFAGWVAVKEGGEHGSTTLV